MKRGSSIGAPHTVQIATGCDGQPTLPSLREALEREPKYQRHIERAGRSGPRCRTWGQAAPVAERGNLKAPEVTQLNYRLAAKLHKAKVCDDRIAARAPRAATPPRSLINSRRFMCPVPRYGAACPAGLPRSQGITEGPARAFVSVAVEQNAIGFFGCRLKSSPSSRV